jgi:hypothetical protein
VLRNGSGENGRARGGLRLSDQSDARSSRDSPSGTGQQTRLTQNELWLLPVAGLVAVVVYSTARSSWSVFGTALMAGAAAFLSGALVGFLFGIPRTLTTDRPAADEDRQGTELKYQPNTNLEQISDWLTKILVGVGLVQISQIRRTFRDLVNSLAPALGNDQTAHAFAGGLLIYSLVGGFLAGYLVTRLRLAGAFAYADRAALDRFVEKIARRTVDEQANHDAMALGLVTRQLESGDVAQEELDASVAAASRAVKVQTFLQAKRLRQDSWKSDKDAIDRVIPVFRALVNADKQSEYHRHFGELGYALKDRRTPDWAGAEHALTTAIHVRDSKGVRGYRLYEFCRAVSRVHLDPSFGTSQASSELVRERILDDLTAAMSGKASSRAVQTDDDVRSWVVRNHVDLAQIGAPNGSQTAP